MKGYESTTDYKTKLQWLSEGFVTNDHAVGNAEWNNRYCTFIVTRYSADQVHKDPETAIKLLREHRRKVCAEYRKHIRQRQRWYLLTRIVGVTFENDDTGENRQVVISNMIKKKSLEPDCPLELRRELKNKYDANAIAIIGPEQLKIGFINRELAATLAPLLDKGRVINAFVNRVLGEETHGIEIRLINEHPAERWWILLVNRLIHKGIAY